MSVFRFRVMYDEDEAIYRDIDILSHQNLMDLEKGILSAFKIKADPGGAFYTSNDSWHKGKKLFTAANASSPVAATASAQAPKLIEIINDPHQHLLYERQEDLQVTFWIELIQIEKQADKAVTYPVCVRGQGGLPFVTAEETVPPITRETPRSAANDRKEQTVAFEAEDEEEEMEPSEEPEEEIYYSEEEDIEDEAGVDEEYVTDEEEGSMLIDDDTLDQGFDMLTDDVDEDDDRY